MTTAEIFQNGLNIISYFKNPKTHYDIKYIAVSKLAKLTGIHRTTIIRWIKENKITGKTAKGLNNEYTWIVDMLSFINYAMYNYRLNCFCTRAGKWWLPDETGVGRTKNAIKIKKWRLKNAQRKSNS